MPESFDTTDAEKCERPHQSGMERKHESWVLDTLNFLAAMNVPVWEKDRFGDRVPGETYEIPTRLNMLTQTISNMRKMVEEVGDLKNEIVKLKREKAAARDSLNRILYSDDSNLFKGSIESVIALLGECERSTDDEDIKVGDLLVRRRFTVLKDLILGSGIDHICHDLEPNEEICPMCLGLGIGKAGSSYGFANSPPGERPFPFRHEWLMACPACYMGKVNTCKFKGCGKVIARNRTKCDCDEQRAESAEERAAKENERRKNLRRVALEDYDVEMVYDDDAGEYIHVDDILDYREEHPNVVFFACKMSLVACRPDGGDIVEDMRDSTCDECPDGMEPFDLKDGAVDALDKAIGGWMDAYVTCSDIYWSDNELIVEVPDA